MAREKDSKAAGKKDRRADRMGDIKKRGKKRDLSSDSDARKKAGNKTPKDAKTTIRKRSRSSEVTAKKSISDSKAKDRKKYHKDRNGGTENKSAKKSRNDEPTKRNRAEKEEEKYPKKDANKKIHADEKSEKVARNKHKNNVEARTENNDGKKHVENYADDAKQHLISNIADSSSETEMVKIKAQIAQLAKDSDVENAINESTMPDAREFKKHRPSPGVALPKGRAICTAVAAENDRESIAGSGASDLEAGGSSGSDAPPKPSLKAGLGGFDSFRDAGMSAPPGGNHASSLSANLRGLLVNSGQLAEEMARMKEAMKGLSRPGNRLIKAEEEDECEHVLRMAPQLHECLLDKNNMAQLLKRTGLSSIGLNEQGLVVARALGHPKLTKAMSILRRVAYHCQWGVTVPKIAALLAERPAKPVNTVVVRLAATTSRLQSFEKRLTPKSPKLRIGTDAGACQLVALGIPGISRKHCTLSFEPEKGACYVQDMSRNGTYLNGKRLPRPPFKNKQDARARVLHGDELMFRLRAAEESEELGYVVNLLELN